MRWISVNRDLPKEGQLVQCYRESPADAEVMCFHAPFFVDLHGMQWDIGAVTFWRPAERPS